MSSEKLPKFVPIDQVSEYTDSIRVYDLGLPVGFDQDRLEINLGALARTSKMAGISDLSIVGYRGDKSEQNIGIGGVFGDGSASAAGVASATKAELYDIEMEEGYDGYLRDYVWKNGVLKLNSNEIESRIVNDGDKWDMRQYDPNARAKYMNKALQQALSNAALESYIPNPKANFAELVGVMAMREVIAGVFMGIDITSKTDIAVVTVGWLPVHAINHIVQKTVHHGNLPERKWSNCYIIPFDRLAAAKTMARTTKFIRATSAKI